MTIIITFGIIQAFFFAILALAKKRKETADYILAALFIILGLQLCINDVMFSDFRIEYPHLIGTAAPFTFVYGPLLFFFIKNYISESRSFKPKYLLHLIPFVLDHIHNYIFLYTLTGSQKLAELNEIVSGIPDYEDSTLIFLRTMSPLIYCVWSLNVLKVHRKNLKKLYSFTTDKLKLDWLWYLAWSMLIVSVLALTINAIIIFFDIADWIKLRMIIFSVVAVWVFLLGYYSIRKTSFYRSFCIEGIDTLELDDLSKQPEKYEKTKLKEEDIPGLKNNLLNFLKIHKPYLNQNLTIGELADSLDIPAYQLSQLINDKLGQSFFELINSYRVAEVKERFFDSKFSNLTLLGIAMECGFNSKASFNRIFKQFTGQTPTEYIKAREVA